MMDRFDSARVSGIIHKRFEKSISEWNMPAIGYRIFRWRGNFRLGNFEESKIAQLRWYPLIEKLPTKLFWPLFIHLKCPKVRMGLKYGISCLFKLKKRAHNVRSGYELYLEGECANSDTTDAFYLISREKFFSKTRNFTPKISTLMSVRLRRSNTH